MSDTWRLSAEGHVHPPQGTADWTEGFQKVLEQWRSSSPTARTSGTTGLPVDHPFSMEAVRASAKATAGHFGLESHPKAIMAWSALPAEGTGGRMMVWRSLALGWDLTVSKPSASPLVPPSDASRGRYDFAVATPMQAQHLMQSGQLDRFALLLLGGGPVSLGLEASLQKASLLAGCKIYHGFGMTETLTHVATRALGTSAYTALPGVEISSTDLGALVLNIPERGVRDLVTKDAVDILLTSSAAVNGRQFHWLGRLDDVINSGGVKLHPAVLEHRWSDHLESLLEGKRWYVTGRPDDVLGARVTLVVEGPAQADLETQILHALEDKGHARPRAVEFQRAFEETESGKVRRT